MEIVSTLQTLLLHVRQLATKVAELKPVRIVSLADSSGREHPISFLKNARLSAFIRDNPA